MRKYFLATVALALVALTASAVPAFTADSGTVTVSVTAQAPPAPCVTVTPGTVNFGTLPFSADAGAGISEGDTDVDIANCGTAGQNLLGATTDAVGPSGAWTPLPYLGTVDPCAAPNRFYLYLFGFTTPALFMTATPAPVTTTLIGPTAAVFPVGVKTFRLGIYMPCRGSNGAGETKALTATFTAVVA